MSSDLVELHGMPITFMPQAGRQADGPAVGPAAGEQAWRVVTNRRHEVIRLNDLDKHLIPLLDGKHSREQIIDKLTAAAASGLINVQKDGISLQDPKDIKAAIGSILEQALNNVGGQALLIA